MTPSVEQMKQGTCGCGRSPTGDCIGWHGLTEDDFRVKLEEYLTIKESAKTASLTEEEYLAKLAQVPKALD